MKTPEIWDRAGSPLCYFIFFLLSLLLFFLLRLCSGVDNIRTWPLWDKVQEPHGSVGNILNAAQKRNTSKECQTLSISDKRFVFPSFLHRISLFWCLRQIWPYTRRIQCAVMCVRPDCHFSLVYLIIKADELYFLFDNNKGGYRIFCIIFLFPSDGCVISFGGISSRLIALSVQSRSRPEFRERIALCLMNFEM